MSDYLGRGESGEQPLVSFYHGVLTVGPLGDRGVIDFETGRSGLYGSVMSTSHLTDQNAAYRSIVERLLRERSDASPSEIVELLGDYVVWGPLDPPAEAIALVEPVAPESAFVAA